MEITHSASQSSTLPPLALKFKKNLKPLDLTEDTLAESPVFQKTQSQSGSASTARLNQKKINHKIYSARNLNCRTFDFPVEKPQGEAEEQLLKQRQKELTYRIIKQLDNQKKCLEEQLDRLKEGAVSAIMEKDEMIERMKERIQENESIKRQLEESSNQDVQVGRANFQQQQLKKTQEEVVQLEKELEELRKKYYNEISERDRIIYELGEDLDKTRARLEEYFMTESSLAGEIKRVTQEKEELEGELRKSKISLSQLQESTSLPTERMQTFPSDAIDAVSQQGSSDRSDCSLNDEQKIYPVSNKRITRPPQPQRMLTPREVTSSGRRHKTMKLSQQWAKINKQREEHVDLQSQESAAMIEQKTNDKVIDSSKVIETLKELNEQQKARHRKEVQSLKREYEEKLSQTKAAMEREIMKLHAERSQKALKSKKYMKPIKSEHELQEMPSDQEEDKRSSRQEEEDRLMKSEQSEDALLEDKFSIQGEHRPKSIQEQISEKQGQELQNFRFQPLELNQSSGESVYYEREAQGEQQNGLVQLAKDIGVLVSGVVLTSVVFFVTKFI